MLITHVMLMLMVIIVVIMMIHMILILLLLLLLLLLMIMMIIILLIIGRPILYNTTTTQRGWCIEVFVSILAESQSQNSLSGGGGVQNLSSQTIYEYDNAIVTIKVSAVARIASPKLLEAALGCYTATICVTTIITYSTTIITLIVYC